MLRSGLKRIAVSSLLTVLAIIIGLFGAHGSGRAQPPQGKGKGIAPASVPPLLQKYSPVTAERLRNPADGDWLMIRRTYDGWGYSPLDQIDTANVSKLRLVWSTITGESRVHEAAPLVGLVYLPGNEAPWTYVPDPNFQFAAGFWNTGIAMGRRPAGADGQPAAQPPRATGPPKEPEGAENKPKASGPFLVAWDPTVNAERWRLTGQGLGGGTLTTAGNLVFQGGHAYNATTGEKLWEMDLGGAPSTPVAYELDGKQYVSLLARGAPATRVFTFVLDGTGQMPAAPVPAGRGGRGGGGPGAQKGAPKQ